jgi:hypothetical protein
MATNSARIAGMLDVTLKEAIEICRKIQERTLPQQISFYDIGLILDMNLQQHHNGHTSIKTLLIDALVSNIQLTSALKKYELNINALEAKTRQLQAQVDLLKSANVQATQQFYPNSPSNMNHDYVVRVKEGTQDEMNTFIKYSLTDLEINQVRRYVGIFRSNLFQEHYEVNNFITNHGLWNQFFKIRSLNDHGLHKGIPGILPKYFKVVCELLAITGACGAPLDKAEPY